jgi:hypothetical protein
MTAIRQQFMRLSADRRTAERLWKNGIDNKSLQRAIDAADSAIRSLELFEASRSKHWEEQEDKDRIGHVRSCAGEGINDETNESCA